MLILDFVNMYMHFRYVVLGYASVMIGSVRIDCAFAGLFMIYLCCCQYYIFVYSVYCLDTLGYICVFSELY